MSSNLIIDTIISGGVSRGLEVPDYWRNENRDPVYDSAYCYRQRSMVARIRHHTPVLQHPASRMEQRLGRAKAEVKPMWDIPFDESMLTAKPGVAIFCPEEALAEELFGILKRNDISWPHSSPRWSNYGESTVYCVSGSRVKFGTKDAVKIGRAHV